MSGRKRNKTKNNQHCKQSFQADNICGNVTKQHSQKFAEYEKGTKDNGQVAGGFQALF